MSSSPDDHSSSTPSSSSSSFTAPTIHALLPDVLPALEKNNRVAVWRLPSEISQSRLGGRTEPSNACTLIALALIELIEARNLHFATPTVSRAPAPAAPPPRTTRSTTAAAAAAAAAAARAPAGAEPRAPAAGAAAASSHAVTTATARYLVGTFIEAMVDGNEAHERALRTRRANEQNFTIPDAISALDKRYTEIDFCSVAGSFNVQLPRFIRIAMRSPSLLPLDRLHFVIIAFERTVLLVADRRTDSFVLLDSHLHGSREQGSTKGAVVAAAHFSELTVLVQWMSEYIFPETGAPTLPQEFEISTVAWAGGERDCAALRPVQRAMMGGFAAHPPPLQQRRPAVPPVPQMRPMNIFIPQSDKENVPPSNYHHHHQPSPPQPPKKQNLGKRSADSLEGPPEHYSQLLQQPASRPPGSKRARRVAPGAASRSSSEESTVAD